MLSLTFKIENPFVEQIFKNLYFKTWKLSKNKFFEIQFMYYKPDIISGYFHWTIKEDHAGISSGLAILGFEISIEFYDCRHWDSDNNCWEIFFQNYK